MSDKVSKAVKPQLRGLLQSQIKRNVIIAIGLCAATGIIHTFTIARPRINQYAEFYKHYDIEKEFETIKNKGLFDSCGPN